MSEPSSVLVCLPETVYQSIPTSDVTCRFWATSQNVFYFLTCNWFWKHFNFFFCRDIYNAPMFFGVYGCTRNLLMLMRRMMVMMMMMMMMMMIDRCLLWHHHGGRVHCLCAQVQTWRTSSVKTAAEPASFVDRDWQFCSTVGCWRFGVPVESPDVRDSDAEQVVETAVGNAWGLWQLVCRGGGGRSFCTAGSCHITNGTGTFTTSDIRLSGHIVMHQCAAVSLDQSCCWSAQPMGITSWWHQSSAGATYQAFNSWWLVFYGCWTPCLEHDRSIDPEARVQKHLTFPEVAADWHVTSLAEPRMSENSTAVVACKIGQRSGKYLGKNLVRGKTVYCWLCFGATAVFISIVVAS